MSKQSLGIVAAVFVILLFFFLSFSGRRSPLLPDVKLVVLVTVDQFADRYVDQFREVLTGGLHDLFEDGAVYRKVRHAHAITETCPGHASIATGTNPAKHGIVSNHWYDTESSEERYCVDDENFGRSPVQMKRSAFPDWLKKSYSKARSFSVSGKDRAAIMMGGEHPNGAFWFDKSTGLFVSSRYYYPRGYPWWLEEFNSRVTAKNYFGTIWNPIHKKKELFEKTKSVDFNYGDFPDLFPHALGNASTAPTKSFYKDVYRSPFLDELTLQFAEELVSQYQLGSGANTDYLSISLSSLDSVGHRYGASSREVHDVIVRADRALGDFFASLDKQVGLDHTLIVFTSDHGIPEFPESRVAQNKGGARVTPEDIACFQSSYIYEHSGKTTEVFEAPLHVSRDLKPSDGSLPKYIKKHVKKKLSACAPVSEVFSSDEIQNYGIKRNDSSVKASIKNNYFAGRSADFFVLLKPHYSLSKVRGVNHGSPYAYDAEVPVVFYHPRLKKMELKAESGREGDSRKITDIAPTLAGLLGVEVPEHIDGNPMDLSILR